MGKHRELKHEECACSSTTLQLLDSLALALALGWKENRSEVHIEIGENADVCSVVYVDCECVISLLSFYRLFSRLIDSLYVKRAGTRIEVLVEKKEDGVYERNVVLSTNTLISPRPPTHQRSLSSSIYLRLVILV